MCGINGITSENEAALKRMVTATEHRGPDATGFHVTPHISLGHNRLSIIDTSDAANQPMHSPDARFTLVFNGEIYNYRDLRDELGKNWQFRTKSDTEVLLAGYVAWGDELLNRLHGIFAFALWDAEKQELLLVRDHMGVKPLYYTIKDGELYFSSELKGILAGVNQNQLSAESFSYFIGLNYVPSPHTLVDGVYKLRPGHLLRFKNKQSIVRRYWNPTSPTLRDCSETDVRTVVDASVKSQLVSDREIGLMLSGGLDSSIVLHHMSQHASDIRTFSIDFEMVAGAEHEAEKFNSDAEIAARTAEKYGSKHTIFTLSLTDIEKDFTAIIEEMDEPISNPSAISRYLLSKWVRDTGVVVALGGDGGDDLFGGYTRHKIIQGAYYFQMLPKILKQLLWQIKPKLKKLDIPFGAPLHMQLLSLKQNAYIHAIPDENIDSRVRSFFEERYADGNVSELGPIDRFMRVDRESWLSDESLAETDRTSMAHGLEVRVPLLDLSVVDFSDHIFGVNKFRPWSSKKILRDAYRGHLPEYLFKQPKRGWLSPGAKWLRNPAIHTLAKNVFSSSYYAGLDPLFDWQAVGELFENHSERRGYHLFPLWNILLLQIWARQHKITL